mmetsp:Transcript_28922/g.75727  ORF Transcript_28922/g.75727 Transcript_28922/m.75727 type:complete len:266 (+) Transcript_28922:371-1168(+)
MPATREVDDLLPLEGQPSQHPRVPRAGALVLHGLLPEPQLPEVVAAPEPELAVAGHRRGEVLPRADLHDHRRLRWIQHRVVALGEVLHLLEVERVARLAPAQPSEGAPAAGVDVATAGQRHSVLGSAGHLHHLLAELHKALHQGGLPLRVVAALPQGAAPPPVAAAVAPRPQGAALGHGGGVLGAQRGLQHPRVVAVRRPQRHRQGRERGRHVQTELVVLIGAVRVKPAARDHGRVAGPACYGSHVVETLYPDSGLRCGRVLVEA